MNIYFCIPFSIYDKLEISVAEKEVKKVLNKYFNDFEVVLINQNEIKTINVVAMGKPKLVSFEKEIIEEIAKVFKVNPSDVNLKTDYYRINPHYNPVSEKPKKISELEKTNSEEFNYEKLSYNYVAECPRFTFDQVVLSKETLEQINNAIGIIKVEKKVFDEWGLRSIIPDSNMALNFHGAPGTGKSMAAEAVAHQLGKKIIKATYADIESKFHGEGPKMVKAIFMAAERQDAVLFLDESDSLLSKRLTNVTDGSAQAINSMRSQLLICLENFKGVVIFASNLVINYDKAFLSRLSNIEFKMPSAEERYKIWNTHLQSGGVNVPLDEDVDINFLSEKYDFCGREIKKAVKSACIKAALNNQEKVNQDNFIIACNHVLKEKENIKNSLDQTNSN